MPATRRDFNEELHIQVSRDMKARIRVLAEQDGRTVSSLMRRVVLAWLNKIDKQSKATA
jgi:hypothetical protein